MPIEYDIVFEGKTNRRIIWGESPNWAREYKEELSAAKRISLIPKNGASLPIITVLLDEGKQWIVFSKVMGRMKGIGAGREFRLYAIGYQYNVNGSNVKHINWVYPGGSIECAEEPSYELVKRLFET